MVPKKSKYNQYKKLLMLNHVITLDIINYLNINDKMNFIIN